MLDHAIPDSGRKKSDNANQALTALTRLLARQAAREALSTSLEGSNCTGAKCATDISTASFSVGIEASAEPSDPFTHYSDTATVAIRDPMSSPLNRPEAE